MPSIVTSITEGIASSCSLMVPCPWAQHAMHLLRRHPQISFGIHLTLFCETTDYRWGPLSAREKVPSLLDETGELFTPAQVPGLLAHARLDEVELEFRAQINAVVDTGLTPTHLDWHCLADGGREDILDLTVELAEEYGLAVRVWLEPGRQKLRRRSMPAGLSEWAVHPGLGNEESQAIDPGGWRVRRTDYEFLTSAAARELVEQEGIVVIDYGPVQRVWPARSHAAVDAGGGHPPLQVGGFSPVVRGTAGWQAVRPAADPSGVTRMTEPEGERR
jgi:predicted glycoside hydrolase/deacetylase ChbG (UPF0249 family)